MLLRVRINLLNKEDGEEKSDKNNMANMKGMKVYVVLQEQIWLMHEVESKFNHSECLRILEKSQMHACRYVSISEKHSKRWAGSDLCPHPEGPCPAI